MVLHSGHTGPSHRLLRGHPVLTVAYTCAVHRPTQILHKLSTCPVRTLGTKVSLEQIGCSSLAFVAPRLLSQSVCFIFTYNLHPISWSSFTKMCPETEQCPVLFPGIIEINKREQKWELQLQSVQGVFRECREFQCLQCVQGGFRGCREFSCLCSNHMEGEV